MSVLLTSPIYIDSVLTPVGTTVSLGYQREQQIVSAGGGTWLSVPTTPTPSASPILNPFRLKRLTVETSNILNVGARPSGSDWLFSAAQNLDTFTSYLQFEPSVFVDFGATTSLSYGTEEQPYNSVADFNRWAQGNRAGAVVGIKRGSHLYIDPTGASISSAGLNVQCYGTAAEPVLFVPYGDPTQPMPIIDGAAVTGSGTYIWTQVGNVWHTSVSADTDVFENGVRCIKKSATPSNPGEAQYTGGVLYYYPRNTANCNDGTLKINVVLWPIAVQAPNVAAPNFVKFIGIDVRHGRGNCARIAPNATNGSIANGYGHVDFLFCRMGKTGFDASSRSIVGSTTIISYNGVDSTHRMGSSETISSRVIGCELYDGTHHAVEHSQSDNGLMEYNYVHDIFGSPFETYADASGHVMRNNRCENMSCFNRLDTLQGSFALLYNFTMATYGGALAFDDTHTKNINNKVYNNWFKNCYQLMFACVGGSGHAIYNNTCYIDHDAIFTDGSNPSKPSGLDTQRTQLAPSGTTSAANGFLDFSNNLIYFAYSPLCKANPGYLNPTYIITETPGVGAAIPTGNNNCYFNQTGFGTAAWNYPTGVQNFTTYKAAMAAYSLDQNSLCANGSGHPISGATYGNNGGTQTLATLLFTENTGKPALGSTLIQGGKNANANRFIDYIGQTVLAVATPAIGCYER